MRCLPSDADGPQQGREAPLVSAARRGDTSAFEQLLVRHDTVLRALAFRMLRDQDNMDDALQDASLKAFKSMARFRGDSDVGTWLYQITYTACIDYLRRERRFRTIPLDDTVCRAVCYEDPCDVATRWAELEDALDQLPVDQRVLIVLVHQFGYDYRAAADVVGVPEGTVASRLAAARGRLRRLLRRPPVSAGVMDVGLAG